MSRAGFLLTVGAGDPRFAACLEAVDAARKRGDEVFLYCLDDGVAAAADPRLGDSADPRFHLLGCAYAAERRGLPRAPGAVYGGLKMLGDVIAHADTFHSF